MEAVQDQSCLYRYKLELHNAQGVSFLSQTDYLQRHNCKALFGCNAWWDILFEVSHNSAA